MFVILLAKNLEGYKRKKLSEIGMSDPATVTLVFRMQGGMKCLEEPLPGWVDLTDEECSILYTEPEPGFYNAEMNCGFVISGCCQT